jgi:AraC-like DNA-binding protein
MIAMRTAIPGLCMQEFVRVYAEREVGPFEPGASALIEAIPARLEQLVEFQFGVPYTVFHRNGNNLITPTQAVVGAQMGGCSHIELLPGVVSFGVFFKPTGFSRLFGLPVCELTDRNFDAALISKLFSGIREILAECPTFEKRVSVIETLLQPMARQAQPTEAAIAAAEHIFSLKGAISVSQLANDTGIGVRQFERKFLECIGVAPKRFARVARFQSALDTKLSSPHRSWLEIAHRLRYYDQMHMVRDFLNLGGDVPSQLLLQIGDARPPARLAEKSDKNNPRMSRFY